MPSPITRGRRLAFGVLTLLLLVAAAELCAWAGLSWLEGRLVSWSDLGRIRADRLGEVTSLPQPDTLNAAQRALRAKQVIHPYLGFVFDRDLEEPKVANDPVSAALGFPYNIHPPYWPPSGDRIVVGLFGGSVAHQLAAAGRRDLERELGAVYTGKEIVVLNFSVPGMKQPQQLMTLAYLRALGVHLDLVVVLDGFNDVVLPVVDNLRQGVHPSYPRLWPLRVVALDGEARRTLGEIAFLEERRRARARSWGEGPWRVSFVAGVLFRLRDRADAARLAGLEEEGAEIDVQHTYQATGPTYREADRDALYTDLATLWRRSAEEMHDLCRGAGIRYLHFLQPNQYVAGSKVLTDEERRVAFDPEHRYKPPVEEGYPYLVRAGERLRDAGVPFYDLTDVFRDHAESVYGDACCHLNPRGDALLAAAIAEAAQSGR